MTANEILISNRERALVYKIGALICILFMLYSLSTILIVALIGGPPVSVQDCFEMLAENRLAGLLRLDILTMFIMPLYYVLFYSLYLTLRNTRYALVTLSTIFVFAGVTLFLAAPSVFSYVRLSDAYQASTTEVEKNRIWAAAEAILSTDIWNGTGSKIGGLLVQLGATVMSLIMLRSGNFNKLTAWIGIATHGLDLVHIIIAFFLPVLANSIMAIAGVLYLLWFPMIAVDLNKLAKRV